LYEDWVNLTPREVKLNLINFTVIFQIKLRSEIYLEILPNNRHRLD